MSYSMHETAHATSAAAALPTPRLDSAPASPCSALAPHGSTCRPRQVRCMHCHPRRRIHPCIVSDSTETPDPPGRCALPSGRLSMRTMQRGAFGTGGGCAHAVVLCLPVLCNACVHGFDTEPRCLEFSCSCIDLCHCCLTFLLSEL